MVHSVVLQSYGASHAIWGNILLPATKTQVADTCTENGGLQNTPSGNKVGIERPQERAETANEKPNGHRQTRPEKHGHCLRKNQKNLR